MGFTIFDAEFNHFLKNPENNNRAYFFLYIEQANAFIGRRLEGNIQRYKVRKVQVCGKTKTLANGK